MTPRPSDVCGCAGGGRELCSGVYEPNICWLGGGPRPASPGRSGSDFFGGGVGGGRPAAGTGFAGPSAMSMIGFASAPERTSVSTSLSESSRTGFFAPPLRELFATSSATAIMPLERCVGASLRASARSASVAGSFAPNCTARSSTFSARSASPRLRSTSPSQR